MEDGQMDDNKCKVCGMDTSDPAHAEKMNDDAHQAAGNGDGGMEEAGDDSADSGMQQ